ncbi:MAG TPA: hypothetical protein PKI35_08445 [Bacteroidales bacterium]|nr:hypothetical protein [Bacteroidales bacterium]
MKAVFIAYNQSLTEGVQNILDDLAIRGYTQWTDIKGQGTEKGDPHHGTHTWPSLNNVHLTIVPDDVVEPLLEKLDFLNKEVEEQGLKAYVWNIEASV